MLLKLCAIFAAGIIIDWLMARYTRAVADKRPVLSASLSAVITVINFTLLSIVLAWIEKESSGVLPIATFAGGSWLGTYFTVRAR